MTIFRLRRTSENPAHVRVQLFTGPDEDHMGLSGELTFRVDEFPAFEAAVADPNVLALVERQRAVIAAAEELADAVEDHLFFEGDYRAKARAAWQRYVEVADGKAVSDA